MTNIIPIPLFLPSHGEEGGCNPYSNKSWNKKMKKKYGKDWKEPCPNCGSIYCKTVGGQNNCSNPRLASSTEKGEP